MELPIYYIDINTVPSTIYVGTFLFIFSTLLSFPNQSEFLNVIIQSFNLSFVSSHFILLIFFIVKYSIVEENI